MTAQEVPVLRWTPEEFVDAWEAGAFEGHRRVQLVDGEVWELGPIQSWHGASVPRVVLLLWSLDARVTTQTLPMPGSMPDVWVLRDGARPVGTVRGYDTWDPADVLLVVEVSDATLRADLTRKAAVYARGEVQHYWVVARDAVHIHTEPGPEGYGRVDVLGPDDHVPLPYGDGRLLAVRELIGA